MQALGKHTRAREPPGSLLSVPSAGEPLLILAVVCGKNTHFLRQSFKTAVFLWRPAGTEEALTTDVRTPLRFQRSLAIYKASHSLLCSWLFRCWMYEKCSPDYVRPHCPKYGHQMEVAVWHCDISKNSPILRCRGNLPFKHSWCWASEEVKIENIHKVSRWRVTGSWSIVSLLSQAS